MQKYFVSNEDFNELKITSSDVFHIKNVMRNKIGDEILIGSNNKTYLAKITNIKDDVINYEIKEEKIGNMELPVFISLFQGYPKGDKLDDIIKHSTEMGVSEIYPTIMKRSLFKLDLKKKESKLQRFNKIAKEAAEQSYRDIIPNVVDIIDLKKIDFSKYDYKILCYEEDAKMNEESNFKRIVKSLKKDDKIAVVIGPEGGIDILEYEYLKNLGFISVGLGKRILRTETVIYYVLSSISYEMELK